MPGKTIKLKAKVIFEWEYKADPEDYIIGGKAPKDITVADMIDIDKISADDDLYLFLDGCIEEPSIEIEEVKENG